MFADNIVLHNQYGIIGTDCGPGRPTLERYFPGARVRNNVIIGGAAYAYPATNYFPASLDDVGFSDRDSGGFQLTGTSPFHGRSSHGTDPGVNVSRLNRAFAASRRGAERTRDASRN